MERESGVSFSGEMKKERESWERGSWPESEREKEKRVEKEAEELV